MLALLRLHLKMAGGPFGILVIPGICVVGAALIAFMSFRAVPPSDYPSVSSTWLAIMTIGGGGVLLLLVPNTLASAVSRDFKCGMIHSHRLTPMSSVQIILGYLAGAPGQMLMLYVGTLILGTYFAASSSIPLTVGIVVGGWWSMQVCLMLLALMLSSFILATSIASGGKSQGFGILFVVALGAGWLMVMFVPGLALILGVLGGQVFLGVMRMGGLTGNGIIIATGALFHVTLAILFIEAASRRLRAPDRPLLNIPSSLIFCLIWLAALILGMHFTFRYSLTGPPDDSQHLVQVIASVAVFMLVGQTVLVAAAAVIAGTDEARAIGVPYSHNQRAIARLMPLCVGLMAAVTLFTLYDLTPPQLQTAPFRETSRSIWRMGAMGLALLASAVLDGSWIYIARLRGKSVVWAIGLSTTLLKILPLLAEAAEAIADEVVRGDNTSVARTYMPGLVAGASPIGTMMAFNMKDGHPWPGLIIQVALAIVAVALACRVRGAFVPASRQITPPSASAPPRLSA
ncbi:MAG: hypothetical protein JXO22_03295 [Phycisphaerae bacterium]|nr:hypothetical protein [Phycisphaerae bacterium]